jgi:hypothetical protein
LLLVPSWALLYIIVFYLRWCKAPRIHKLYINATMEGDANGTTTQSTSVDVTSIQHQTQHVAQDTLVGLDFLAEVTEFTSLLRDNEHLSRLARQTDLLVDFVDLAILSSDGTRFDINAAVLASVSTLPALFQTLLETEKEVAISAEISSDHLRTVLDFVVTGSIPADTSAELKSSFKAMGVDLEGKRFTAAEFDRDAPAVRSEDIVDVKLEVLQKSKRKITTLGKRRAKAAAFSYAEDEDEASFIDENDEYGDGEVKDELGENEDEMSQTPKGRKYKSRSSKSDLAVSPPLPAKRSRASSSSTRKAPRRHGQFIYEGERDTSKEFQCDQCLFGTVSRKMIANHRLLHKYNIEDQVTICRVCEQIFPTKELFDQHFRNEHRDAFSVCPICGKKYTAKYRASFEAHVRDHENYEACVACGYRPKNGNSKKTTVRKAILNHMEWKGPNHNGQCVQCKESFSKWDDHEKHVNTVHGGVWKYHCGFCSDIFDVETDLKVHRVKVHRNDAGVAGTVCDICGADVKMIKSHQEDFHGDQPSPCSRCDKVLRHPNSLKRHMRIDHGDWPCSTCGKIFNNTFNLKLHVLNMHTADDKKPYRCDVCQKGFITRPKLQDHMNIHLDLKPHKCRYCEMGFRDTSNRSHHERAAHTGTAGYGKKRKQYQQQQQHDQQLQRQQLPLHAPLLQLQEPLPPHLPSAPVT